MRSLAVPAVLLAVCVSGHAYAEKLGKDDIQRDIIGRTIFLAVPLGGEFPLNYRTSGTVDGNGQAVGLGKFTQPKDSGKWWIDGDRLCQKFKTWYDGSPMCFELFSQGADKVKWIRNNGETGVARIGN